MIVEDVDKDEALIVQDGRRGYPSVDPIPRRPIGRIAKADGVPRVACVEPEGTKEAQGGVELIRDTLWSLVNFRRESFQGRGPSRRNRGPCSGVPFGAFCPLADLSTPSHKVETFALPVARQRSPRPVQATPRARLCAQMIVSRGGREFDNHCPSRLTRDDDPKTLILPWQRHGNPGGERSA